VSVPHPATPAIRDPRSFLDRKNLEERIMVRTACVRFGGALLALGLVVACSDLNSGGPEEAPLPVEQVDTLDLSIGTGISDPMREVIRTEPDWQAFWTQYQSNMSPAQPAPTIDFGQRMVIVAAMGSRPTGGFTIRIESVAQNGNGYDVGVVETSPGSSCIVTQMVTAPVAGVVVPVADGDVHFSERKTVHECG
jgi:hypothetical protein